VNGFFCDNFGCEGQWSCPPGVWDCVAKPDVTCTRLDREVYRVRCVSYCKLVSYNDSCKCHWKEDPTGTWCTRYTTDCIDGVMPPPAADPMFIQSDARDASVGSSPVVECGSKPQSLALMWQCDLAD
jgi:hypothetical protein